MQEEPRFNFWLFFFFRKMYKNNQNKATYKLVATFFGAGYLPMAPGTFGAIFAMIISLTLLYFNLSFYSYQAINFFLIIISYLLGVKACTELQEEWGSDPSRVVIDEACGYWVTLLFVPLSWKNLLIALILFRIFDIAKPLGIKKIDQMHNSSHAVMLDDVVAGIYGCICLHSLNYFFNLS